MSRRWLFAFLMSLAGMMAALLAAPKTAPAAEEAPPALVLVNEGKPVATIVLRQGAEGPLPSAAEALQGYIQQMSGALLPIASDTETVPSPRLLIGSSRATQGIQEDLSEERLGYDGCVVRTRGEDVAFLGPRDAGAANGVYWFLEWVLGVHRLGMRDDALALPSRKTISVPEVYYAHKPSFAWRASWISSPQQAYSEEEINNFGKYWALNRRGGIPLSGAHSLYSLVPSSLFEEHPDYFPLINGQRTTEGQLCLSHPEVLERVVQHLKSLPTDYGGYVSISPNDLAGWCECEDCRRMAEDPGARMMLFCNRVIEAVEPTHPRLGACFLAYDISETMEPPLGMEAHPRVVPLIAPLVMMPVHPLNFLDCPNSKELDRIYRGWREVAERVTTYPYMYGGPLPGVLPLPVPAVVVEDLRYYHHLGLIGVQREHVGHYGARGLGWELSFWLEWQLLWDIDQDVEALRKVFFQGYYGAAAEPMRRLYERLETAVMSSPVGPPRKGRAGADCAAELGASLEPTRAANRQDIQEALRLADTPAARAHVEIEELALTLMEEALAAQTAFRQWQEHPSEENRQAALARITPLMEQIQNKAEDIPSLKYLARRLGALRPTLEGTFAREWMVIGPFAGGEGKGLETIYGPEREIEFNRSYPGKGGVSVRWKKVSTPPSGHLDFSEVLSSANQVVGYALTHVYSPEAEEVPLLVGSDDGVKVWVQGQLVWTRDVQRGASPDQDQVTVQLEKGWNRILAKVENHWGGWGLYLRIPHRAVRFSAQPD